MKCENALIDTIHLIPFEFDTILERHIPLEMEMNSTKSGLNVNHI